MKQAIIILSLLGLVLYSHAQNYISLSDGTFIKSVNEESYSRNVEILDDGILVTYNLGVVQTAQDPIYSGATMLKMKGFGVNHMANEPSILGRIDAFTLPVGASALLSIENTEYIDLRLKLSPARPLLSEKTYETYSKDNVPPIKAYKGWYPQNIVDNVENQNYRGTPVAYFSVKPVQYNYETSTVRIYSKIAYKVTFVSNGKVTTDTKKISPNDYMLRNTTVNQGHVSKPVKSMKSVATCVDVTKDYLIITVPQFLEAVNRFAEWKRLMGYNVIVSSRNSWTYDEVLEEVQTQYYTSDSLLYYYLIVGSQSLVNSKYAGENYYTDYYIGCMGGEFDYENDVYGGRLPVTTLSEANAVIDKIISYEQNPILDYDFYNTGVNCTCFLDSDRDGYEDRRYTRTTERIANYVTKVSQVMAHLHNLT